MSTRGRGRGRRGRVQSGAHFMLTLDEIPQTECSNPEIGQENTVSQEREGQSINETNEIEHDGQSSEGQNSSRARVRGEMQGSHAPNNRDSRTLIQPYHDGFVQGLVPRRIMDLLRQYMGPWPTWEQVPRHRKVFLYEKFKEKFMWLPEHEAGIRHSWEQTHKRNYKNTIYRFKKKAIEEAGGDDPRDIQKVVPKNMSSSDWETICGGHMNTPSYRDKCKRAKQNRMTEKDGSITKHTGGSISFAEHGRRMSQDGRMISQVELHDRTHKKSKGKGEYVDNKSRRVREEYDQEYASQHGSNPTSESSFDAQKWIQITGGPSKGRVYSFGNTYRSHELVAVGTSSETASMPPPLTYVSHDQLNDAVKALDEKLAKQEEATALREANITEKTERMAAQAQKMAEEASKIIMTFGNLMAKFASTHDGSSSSK